MKLLKIFLAIVFTLSIIASCNSDDGLIQGNNNSNNNNNVDQGWDIPQSEVFDGGPGKDGIPALQDPEFVSADEIAYLEGDELVLGYKNGEELRAYPHAILDWHEIVNDHVNDHSIAVTYCPLTGTGIGWENEVDGVETTFGVSGLLYNSNLIPYDRRTDSNWSQIRLNCVNGELRGQEIQTFHLVETSWNTWKTMYPQTRVVSTNTGYSRNYNRYPYGDYKTNNFNTIFPYSPEDDRLPIKERVHGIIINERARAYRFQAFFDTLTVIEDSFLNIPLVIAGSEPHNFIVSFERTLDDGTVLTFVANNRYGDITAEILLDDEGNVWNIFGEAVSGPRQGEKLKPTTSFMGYWFSWGAFYPDLDIYRFKPEG